MIKSKWVSFWRKFGYYLNTEEKFDYKMKKIEKQVAGCHIPWDCFINPQDMQDYLSDMYGINLTLYECHNIEQLPSASFEEFQKAMNNPWWKNALN